MPISAGQAALESSIFAALSLDKAAEQNIVAPLIMNAIASIVPMGIFPTGPTPVNLSPAGLAGSISASQGAYNLAQGAEISAVAQLLASAISILAPTAPPAGLSGLQTQLESALSMDKGADIGAVAAQMSGAIIQYYLSGGVA